MANKQEQYVTVDKLAQAFRMSERAVQRMCIYEGMPRRSRNEYPYFECLSWFIAKLHKKICRNCDELVHGGPCRGMEVEARAERQRALEKITEVAPALVGLSSENQIRKILEQAIEDSFR